MYIVIIISILNYLTKSSKEVNKWQEKLPYDDKDK